MPETTNIPNESDERMLLSDVVSINYLTSENAVFGEKNGFLTLKAKVKNADGIEEEKEYDRIFLHRAFPYDKPFEYISVLDRDSNEIGLIRDVSALDEAVRARVVEELGHKYYCPVIKSILSVRERYGYAYFRVLCDEGELSFTVQDVYRSMLKIGDGRIFISDIDGNRYEIPNVYELDRASYRKIELHI
ncbi:MAG: DUF1854 domain-containing protein [Clostridia bacterium]|nr:DUF1854 domain-containing protein [Clostridia bacterium]